MIPAVVLVDTSVWVEHLRAGNAVLTRMLDEGLVLTHPFVIGELALGNLRHRSAVLEALRNLKSARVAAETEILHFIEANRLAGAGIGYVDAHLLAAVRLTPGATLWTSDRRLRRVAARLGMAEA